MYDRGASLLWLLVRHAPEQSHSLTTTCQGQKGRGGCHVRGPLGTGARTEDILELEQVLGAVMLR
jgi:hypothetical protein